MPSTNIYISDSPIKAMTTLIITEKELLNAPGFSEKTGISETTFQAMVKHLNPGYTGASQSTYVGEEKIILAVLPENASRHNSNSRAWCIPSMARQITTESGCIRLMLKPEHIEAAILSIGRAFPIFHGGKAGKKLQNIALSIEADGNSHHSKSALKEKLEAVRFAAQLVDMPPNLLNVSLFVEMAREIATSNNLPMQVIRGEALIQNNLNGIWAVGKGATEEPALVHLRWSPPNPKKTISWVGKGIVYDSGGLSIKNKTGLPSMKGDMGGAAAVLGAFKAAVKLKVPYEIHAILCLAENAVDANATRPDDIIMMHSGRSVEVNNTDAEGRLVLADGLSWCAQNTLSDVLIDVATLTGAAQVSIGKNLGAIYTNKDSLEQLAVESGKAIGEPVYPLPYTPEFHFREFQSAFADMTNSVKDRANAQSSCAAYFIESHLPKPAPPWLHIDIAGPSWGHQKRGTGFGVGLLLEIGLRFSN